MIFILKNKHKEVQRVSLNQFIDSSLQELIINNCWQMINKKVKGTKVTIEYFYYLLAINIVVMMVIIVFVFRRKKAEQRKNNTQIISIVESRRQSKSDSTIRREVSTSNYRQSVTAMPIEGSVIKNVQIISENAFQLHQITQTDPTSSSEEIVRLLEEELELQRKRNELLEQKNQLVEEQLNNLRCLQHEDKQNANLKNELQFCQMRLSQSLENENNLRQRLTDYERMSISMLNHPQYKRLRQLNNKYKDTIAKLQQHLLKRNEGKDQYLEVSFHNL